MSINDTHRSSEMASQFKEVRSKIENGSLSPMEPQKETFLTISKLTIFLNSNVKFLRHMSFPISARI